MYSAALKQKYTSVFPKRKQQNHSASQFAIQLVLQPVASNFSIAEQQRFLM